MVNQYKFIDSRSWLRIYTINKEFLNKFLLSDKISLNFENKIDIIKDNKNNIEEELIIKNMSLIDNITRENYFKQYLKMTQDQIDNILETFLNEFKQNIPIEYKRIKENYLKQVIEIYSPFYIIEDKSNVSYIILSDKFVKLILTKINEKLGTIPNIYELPDGPNFFLWLFSKYWYNQNIGDIKITNVTSISNIEESYNHLYNHLARGDSQKNSLEICFKLTLNKVITSLKFTISYEDFEVGISINIPDYANAPKSFKFIVHLNEIKLPEYIKEKINELEPTKNKENFLEKNIAIYIIFNYVLKILAKQFDLEKNEWEKTKKDEFLNEIKKYAVNKLEVSKNAARN